MARSPMHQFREFLVLLSCFVLEIILSCLALWILLCKLDVGIDSMNLIIYEIHFDSM